jgi:quercetin dioxygenase-like cupin family protein
MDEFPEFIRALPEVDVPIDGVTGHLLQGKRHQVAFIAFDRDTVVPRHSHRAQWELVVAGEVVLEAAGEERTYSAGDSFYLPEGVEHGARVRAGYRAVVFFDQADRYAVKRPAPPLGGRRQT